MWHNIYIGMIVLVLLALSVVNLMDSVNCPYSMKCVDVAIKRCCL